MLSSLDTHIHTHLPIYMHTYIPPILKLFNPQYLCAYVYVIYL